MEQGLVHLYWGDGKGKTTCAIGLGLRVIGCGGTVLLTQFLKSNGSSERKAIASIRGFDCIEGPERISFSFQMHEKEREQARKCCVQMFSQAVRRSKEKNYRLLILDELCEAISEGFLKEERVLHFLEQKPKELEVVITGHQPSENIMNRAEYITHFQNQKHPYQRGICARLGIEY